MSLIIPDRTISEIKIQLAKIGGADLDYLEDPKLGRAIDVGHPTINQVMMILLNRTDALVREVVSLRERLSKLDGTPLPTSPTQPPQTTGVPEPQDPFAAAVEDARRKSQAGAPPNGAPVVPPVVVKGNADDEN